MPNRNTDNSIELHDLVYAPLGAVAEANIRLSSNIVNFLASTGDLTVDASGKSVVRLRTIQMMYEQLGSDAMDNKVADSIGLEIPLLSIFPLSALKVAKTKVKFNAEILGMKQTTNGLAVITQASSGNRRNGMSQPNIQYEVEMESAPISEGLARFVDTLNTNAMPKRLHSTPVDESGKKLTGRERGEYEKNVALTEREARLTIKINDLRESMRKHNNTLEMETGASFDELTEHYKHLRETGEKPQIPEAYEQVQSLREITAELEAQLSEVRQEILSNKLGSLQD
ncbi:MAG: DUF2589 domain-containing protein [Defluviitaleaceae bacterium]|nr:DUF2589 domain-containing protein [Defluviitaleaceae bacterium]MCL2274448.1 DUF2589 domain-containing protein [Defluviitaleaceae bacterium]